MNTANVNVFFRRALGAERPGADHRRRRRPDRHARRRDHGDDGTEGGWFQRPDRRRPPLALNTNDLRGKILRIKVKDGDITPRQQGQLGAGGAYTIPAGQPVPARRGAPQAKTRPEIYAMGFRNPFRIQVDENDVAYITDYSPDSQTPQRLPRPGGHRPVRDRAPAGELRLAVLLLGPTCRTTGGTSTSWRRCTLDGTRRQRRTQCDRPRTRSRSQRLALEPRRRPGVEPGLRRRPAGHRPGHLVLVPRQPRRRPRSARRASPTTRRRPGRSRRARRPSARGCSPSSTPAASARTARRSTTYDPANPNPTKFPPYYDGSIFLGEFTQDTLREIKLDSQNRVFKINNFLDCGRSTPARPATVPVRVRQPDGHAVRRATAHFYLLTYGDGFFNINPDAGMYKWDYVKGQRAPKAVLTTDTTDGPLPLTVQFSSAGSSDADPGDSIRFEWDFGDGTADSIDPNPTHTYTDGRPVHGRPDGHRLVRQDDVGEHDRSRRATRRPTVIVNTPVEGGLFAFGDTIPFTVTVTDPEDGPIDCAEVQVTFVLGHDTHGHAEADRRPAAPACCRRSPTTSRTAATCSA